MAVIHTAAPRLVALLCMLPILVSAVSASLEQELLSSANEHLDYMVEARRRGAPAVPLPPYSQPGMALHQHPELGFKEELTSAYLRRQLTAMGVPFKHPVALTGIVATIGTRPSPRFALRTDIDALPILEEVDVDYVSQHPGRMHACGHDAHMAMLLGAAKVLKAREAELPGTVVLIFQPAEEGPGGAPLMIAEGALEGVTGAAGIHVWPGIPSGIFASRPGTLMAAADTFQVTIRGRGGHGAMPHLAADPVVAAAAVVAALQPLVSRETSPTDSAVVTVARFNTGPGAPNVIPDQVVLSGTMRALTVARFHELQRRVTSVIGLTAEAHGCDGSNVTWEAVPYPPTVNDAGMHALGAAIAAKLSSFELLLEPTMGGEDFSFIAQQVPSSFMFLGIRNESAGSVHGLHTPRFTMDESVMPLGASLHASMAFRGLQRAAAAAATGAAASHTEL